MVQSNIKEIRNTDKSDKIENNLENLENFEAEIAIIGCLLWDNRNYEKIADFLSEDHFVDLNNKKIFKVIKQLLDQNILVTPITLKNYLDSENEEGFNNHNY